MRAARRPCFDPPPRETQLRPPPLESYRSPARPLDLVDVLALDQRVNMLERAESARMIERLRRPSRLEAACVQVVLVATLLGAGAALGASTCSARAQPVLEGVPDGSRALDGPEPQSADSNSNREGTVGAALERALLSVVRHPRSGRFARHCSEAPGGCEARIRRIARAVLWETRDGSVDPWLVVAIMARESGLNADALGAAGELGLMQLHPQGDAARAALLACHRARARSCGTYLIREGVRLLASAIKTCGSEEQGLSRYNTGRCISRSGAGEIYARRVIARRDALLAGAR